MADPQPNRAVINGPATVERNIARLQRLAAAARKPGVSDERKTALTAEAERLRTSLLEQQRAIEAAVAALDTEAQVDAINAG